MTANWVIEKRELRFNNELLGKRYTNLVIEKYLGFTKYEMNLLCRCDCGNEKVTTLSRLRGGHIKSCGCLFRKHCTTFSVTHGLSSHPIYHSWSGMLERCYNSNLKCYGRYGGAGVTVCQEWKDDFMAFYKWSMANGWSIGLEIDKDKIPYQKGIPAILYSPETCCFLTSEENNRYRESSFFLEYKGEIKPFAEWCEIYGIKYHTLYKRIVTEKWDIEKAFNYDGKRPQHSKSKKIKCINTGEEFISITDAALKLGLQTSKISMVLSGKRPHTKNYKFEFCG